MWEFVNKTNSVLLSIANEQWVWNISVKAKFLFTILLSLRSIYLGYPSCLESLQAALSALDVAVGRPVLRTPAGEGLRWASASVVQRLWTPCNPTERKLWSSRAPHLLVMCYRWIVCFVVLWLYVKEKLSNKKTQTRLIWIGGKFRKLFIDVDIIFFCRIKIKCEIKLLKDWDMKHLGS